VNFINMPLKVSDCDIIELADDRTLEESASAVGCHFIEIYADIDSRSATSTFGMAYSTVIISVFRGTAMQQ